MHFQTFQVSKNISVQALFCWFSAKQFPEALHKPPPGQARELLVNTFYGNDYFLYGKSWL